MNLNICKKMHFSNIFGKFGKKPVRYIKGVSGIFPNYAKFHHSQTKVFVVIVITITISVFCLIHLSFVSTDMIKYYKNMKICQTNSVFLFFVAVATHTQTRLTSIYMHTFICIYVYICKYIYVYIIYRIYIYIYMYIIYIIYIVCVSYKEQSTVIK